MVAAYQMRWGCPTRTVAHGFLWTGQVSAAEAQAQGRPPRPVISVVWPGGKGIVQKVEAERSGRPGRQRTGHAQAVFESLSGGQSQQQGKYNATADERRPSGRGGLVRPRSAQAVNQQAEVYEVQRQGTPGRQEPHEDGDARASGGGRLVDRAYRLAPPAPIACRGPAGPAAWAPASAGGAPRDSGGRR